MIDHLLSHGILVFSRAEASCIIRLKIEGICDEGKAQELLMADGDYIIPCRRTRPIRLELD